MEAISQPGFHVEIWRKPWTDIVTSLHFAVSPCEDFLLMNQRLLFKFWKWVKVEEVC